MSRWQKLEAMLHAMDPVTRRQFLTRAAATGLAAPALGHLAAGSRSAAAAPARQDLSDPVQGGTMVVLGHQEVASLSPDDAGPTVHYVVVTQIHNALVEANENFEFLPVLAEELPEVSDDGLTYTFRLRQGVPFHDGEEFTAEDVKYTYEWYMDPENAAVNANDFATVESVETLDDYTVVVNLSQPNAAFFPQVASTFIVPAHYHGEIGEDAYKAAPIGTGPFKLREWRAAEFTEVEAFEDHFRGRPNIDVFRLNVVPEASVRTIALETGEADSSAWPLVAEDDLRLADSDEFTTFITANVAVNHFPLNNTHPILGEKAVRQAIMTAIDRQTVVDDIFSGAAVLATSNLSPAIGFYYTDDVPTYEYAPERAAEILEEAGWTMGDDGVREERRRIPHLYHHRHHRRPSAAPGGARSSSSSSPKSASDMQIEEAPVATILDQMRSGEMDAALFNWTYGGDDGDPDASHHPPLRRHEQFLAVHERAGR